ncbi:MAG: cysteine desulfurase family protein [Bacillota bacterium]
MKNPVYLDNAGTTKTHEEVAKVMMHFLTEEFYNPSAVTKNSIAVSKNIDKARMIIARGMKITNPACIIFTSGGTESNNLAILGNLPRQSHGKILCSACEHPAVFNIFKDLKEKGYDFETISCNRDGSVNLQDYTQKISSGNVAMVSVMHVNNEAGGINDIAKLAKMLKAKHPTAFFHSDGVQGFCKVKANLENVDAYSASAHKINGPKGVGALYIKNPNKLKNQVFGGGQEKNKRSGTENVAGILGFAKAVEIWQKDQSDIIAKYKSYKDIIIAKLQDVPNMQINSSETSSPHILNVSFDGVRGETLLHMCEEQGYIIGMGSACSAKQPISRPLKEMGITSNGTIRISFSIFNTQTEIEEFACTLKTQLEKLREIMK